MICAILSYVPTDQGMCMTVQYLIDSENVGDFWIPLLDLPAGETELIVFYTRNSPHMSYDSLIRLKESNRTVTFIKCYEGTNALDFQLVSELGYRICSDEDGRFVIVTNDTGFDAAVKYWRRRKKSVKRITGKEARNLERRIREDLSAGHAKEPASAGETEVPVRRYTAVEHDSEHDAHVDAYHAETALDPDGRSSRSSLRDVEAALEPEPDDQETADPGFTDSLDDLEMDHYEPEDDELNEDAAEESEEESYEESAEETEEEPEEPEEMSSFDEDEDDEEEEGTDSSFDEEEAAASEIPFSFGTSDAGYDPEEEDPVSGQDSGDEVIRAYEQLWSGEQEASASDTGNTDIGFEDLLIEAKQLDFMAQVNTGGHDDSDPAQETQPEAETEDPSEPAENAQETPAEEEPDPEAQHRSRSRRSRSRRSRSSSKKQEKTDDRDDTREEQAEGAEDTAEAGAASEAVETAGDQSSDTDSAEESAGSAAPVLFDASMPPGDEEIARIAACIGLENLAELHNQLATFYGDQGKDIYLSIKNNTRSLPVLNPDLKQKFAYYCEIIFARSDYTGEYPSDISEYLLSVREKLNNLNSLRYALQKHYGKEKGRRYYFLLKPFAKTMYQM